MTLTLEQWHEILNVVRSNSNSNGNDILEQIKAELKKQDKGTFQTWEQKGFDVNHLFNTRNDQIEMELTLLHIAAFNGHLDIVKYLVDEKKVDVNKTDKFDETALHLAARNGHLDTVKYLVDEKKVDVNKTNNHGSTALYKAVFNGHLDTVKYFVDEKKVDVNIANKYGETPLHLAAEIGKMDVVKFLLNKGADPSLKNRNGKTPRDLADSENVKQLNSTKGNKLPIITACAGLLLGLGIAYLAGAATLTPVGAAIAVFLAAAVVGALVGYGVGEVSQKLFVESIKEHLTQGLNV